MTYIKTKVVWACPTNNNIPNNVEDKRLLGCYSACVVQERFNLVKTCQPNEFGQPTTTE
jgi:hypothetical protein